MKMKIKIVVEDKKNGVVEIPVTNKQARLLYQMGFYFCDNESVVKTLKMNNDYNTFYCLVKKGAILTDCIDDGRCFKLDKKGKSVPTDHEYFHSSKRPSWKINGVLVGRKKCFRCGERCNGYLCDKCHHAKRGQSNSHRNCKSRRYHEKKKENKK